MYGRQDNKVDDEEDGDSKNEVKAAESAASITRVAIAEDETAQDVNQAAVAATSCLRRLQAHVTSDF